LEFVVLSMDTYLRSNSNVAGGLFYILLIIFLDIIVCFFVRIDSSSREQSEDAGQERMGNRRVQLVTRHDFVHSIVQLNSVLVL